MPRPDPLGDALVSIARDVALARDLPSALQVFVDGIRGVVGASRADVIFRGAGGRAAATSPATAPTARAETLEQLIGFVTDPLQLSADELAIHPARELVRDLVPVPSGLLAVPFWPISGSGAGVLVAVARPGGDFDERHEHLAASLSQLAGLAIETVHHRVRAEEFEARFEGAVGGSPFAVVIHDEEGRVVRANDEAHRLLGVPAGGLIGEGPGNPVWDLVHEDGSPIAPDQIPAMRARALGMPQIGVVGIRHHLTRERRWGLVAAHEIPGRAEVVTIGADVTDRVRARALHERQQRVLTAIASGRGIDHVLDTICRSVDDLTDRGTSSVLLREGDTLRRAAAPGVGPHQRRPRDVLAVGREGGPCGLAVQWGEAVMVTDVATDPAWLDQRDQALAEGWNACWAVPFRLRDDTVAGALVVHDAVPRSPTDHEQRVLETFRDLAAIALDADRAQRRLQASQEEAEAAGERLRALIEGAPLAIFELDAAGLVRLWNRAAERVFGWRREEVLGLAPPMVRDDDSGYVEVRARVLRGEILRDVELVQQKKDGSLIEVALAASPIFDEHGEVTGALAMMADVSDRLRLEQQLLRAQRMEAVGRLAGGIAHDFNNLLTAIRGHVEFLMEDATDTDALEDLEAVRLAAGRGAKLTSQLLAVGRRQLVKPEVVVLDEILTTMRPLLERLLSGSVEVGVESPPDLGGVRIDPVQIEQVILNLAVNARDAMPSGGVLTFSVDDVDLSGDDCPPELEPGPYVRMTVTDTGEGMDAPTLTQVFEPFFTTKDPAKGTGLGLAAAYGIIAQAGGHLSATSQPGLGSTFTVLLPRVDRPQSAATPAEESPVPRGGPETILLVEDEEPVRVVAEKVLVRQGYTVLVAADGEEAVKVAAAHPAPIHLLVSDVVLPRLSGTDVARRLSRERPGLRVLLVSGYAEEQPLEAGVTGEVAFLAKPFGPTELARKVREVLDAAWFGMNL